nr:MAG TPA: hypothetical protein [Caudoviricetes sp.]
MATQGKESAARCDRTRMAGERINNPATSRGREQMTASPSVK